MAPTDTPDTPPTGRELFIERIFDAPRELVWRAWTEPDLVMRWWGPEIFTCPVAQIDLRVGGKFLFCMQSDSGPEIWQKGIWSTGVYREIVEPERIVCTDCFADEQGNVVPATYYGMPEDIPLEMLLTVTFEEYEGKTRLTLRHVGLPETMEQDAGAGWSQSLDKMAVELAALSGCSR